MATTIADEVRRLAIGKKIRTLRERHNIALAEVAARTAMPEVLLAQIESEVVTPTVAALVNIAAALGTEIDTFFRDAPFNDQIEIVRQGEGRNFQRVRGAAGTPLSYSYESLAYRLAGKHMEPFLVEFSLETAENSLPVSHDGEEFLHILAGEVEFISGEDRAILRPGDSIYFYSKAPHSLRGLGTVAPRAVVVLYPYSR